MSCGVAWFFFTALEYLKKENNRPRAASETQHQKTAYMATPRETLISSIWRKVYAENQTLQERTERRQQSNIWRDNGTSLVTQWLRIHLPMQGTWVRALVPEDPTLQGAAKPVHHNYWACALEPVSHNYWAHALQLLKAAHLEPVLHNKRSHCNEKPTHRNEE